MCLSRNFSYEFGKNPFDVVCGTDKIRRAIESGSPLKEIESSWQTESEAFRQLRKKYLLY
jgi:uncharacterized protein YbbC (DUF1343 family)